MSIFNTRKILRMLLACMVIIVGASHKGESAEAYMRRRLPHVFQQSDDLARKATEAAKRGDVTTSQQHLNQIETLSPYPRIKSLIQNSTLVQEAKNAHVQAEQTTIRIAAQKAEEEKRAKEQEIANRIAFEKEAAQKQIAQRQEDERRTAIRLHQQAQPQVQQAIPDASVPQTPQTLTHQDGKSFASSLMADVINSAKSTNPQNVPGFQTDKPKEASLKPEALGDAALAESRTNEIAQHLTFSAQNRPTFKFDTNVDPLFVNANQVTKNPESTLKEEITEVSGPNNVSEEIKICEEGGDEYQQTCTKRLEIVLKITPAHMESYQYCPGNHEFKEWGTFHVHHWTDYCPGRNCTTGQRLIPKDVKVIREAWVDGCGVLEDHVEKGLCRYISTSQSPKNETRMIQGEPIPRDHFEEYYNYACFRAPPSFKSCAGLREQGCFQIGSTCQETVGGVCVLWQQTYSCPSEKKSGKSYRASNKENPFCLTGNCADTSYEANNEMMNAMSHLYALREAQNDLREFKVIFKGTHRWCTRNCLDFRDCCGSGKGWGVSLHLSSCDSKEIELRTLRDKNLCVQIGTYCAERDKVFNSCLRKKTTFCCYGTKMARLIQQNGRAQLGLGWGRVESPDCNGLSPEQLSRIDFSKINFSEIFEDIKSKTVVKDQKQSLAQVSTERLQNNMTLLTKPEVDRRPSAVSTKSPEIKSAQDLQELRERGL